VLWMGLSLFFHVAAGLTGPVQGLPPGGASGKYSLSGTVSNSVTGAPISRALVQLVAASARSTLTDNQGRFHFEELPASDVTLSARKPGFFSEQEVAQSGSAATPETFHLGQDTPVAALKLTPEGVIFGRMSSDGQPVEAVPVKLISPRIRDGRKVWEQSGYATPDEDGDFRISGLLPGTYYIAAGPNASLSSLGINTQASGYSEVFYPGVSDIASAEPFELAAGQQVEADFSLKPERVFQVSGTIHVFHPVKGINLQFVNSLGDAGSFPYRFDPVSGGFVSSVTAGAYTLRAQAFENGEVGVAELPLSVSSNLSGVALALAPAASIPVLVSADFVTAQGKRMAESEMPSFNMHFVSSDFQLTSADYWAISKGEGKQRKVSFENVQPGRYAAEVNPDGSYYVESARCGGTDLLRDDLTVTAEAHLPAIEVVLRDDGASLDISLPATPVKATVLLVPDRAPRQVQHGLDSGRLRFEGLAPGGYSVLAFDNTDKLEYKNPEVLSPYLGSAVHVTLGPRQNSSITLQAIQVGK
jgi:Carboxypeptidase regulatory-like domain